MGRGGLVPLLHSTKPTLSRRGSRIESGLEAPELAFAFRGIPGTRPLQELEVAQLSAEVEAILGVMETLDHRLGTGRSRLVFWFDN